MRARFSAVAGVALAALFSSPGQAQYLGCTTTSGLVCDASGCRNVAIVEVKQYPANVNFQMMVRGQGTRAAPLLLEASDPLLEANAAFDASSWMNYPRSTPSNLPLDLNFGFAYTAVDLTLSSYEQCRTLAGAPAASGPVFLDNRLIVSWDGGQAQCTSRAVCFP